MRAAQKVSGINPHLSCSMKIETLSLICRRCHGSLVSRIDERGFPETERRRLRFYTHLTEAREIDMRAAQKVSGINPHLSCSMKIEKPRVRVATFLREHSVDVVISTLSLFTEEVGKAQMNLIQVVE
jgi:hypothetical protein